MKNKGEKRETGVADRGDANVRLDRFLASKFEDLSRTRLKQLILSGEVSLDGRTIKDPEHRVKPGNRFAIQVPPPLPAKPAGEKIPLSIVYEDDQLIVIDKPAGLVVHPAAGHRSGTLVNALIAHCGESLSGIGGERRPGIVHRLDKDTTGLLVVAKTDHAHLVLAKQFADHGRSSPLERGYLALAWGVPKPTRGTIDKPIARDAKSRVKMAVRAGGRHAVTNYKLCATYKGANGKPTVSLIECRLETGRTHQIRVHLAKIGHPLLGDKTYGAGFHSRVGQLSTRTQRALKALDRQALHAYLLGFTHPTNGKLLSFESKLPKDLAKLLSSFTL